MTEAETSTRTYARTPPKFPRRLHPIAQAIFLRSLIVVQVALVPTSRTVRRMIGYPTRGSSDTARRSLGSANRFASMDIGLGRSAAHSIHCEVIRQTPCPCGNLDTDAAPKGGNNRVILVCYASILFVGRHVRRRVIEQNIGISASKLRIMAKIIKE